MYFHVENHAFCITAFFPTARLPHMGGGGPLFTPRQEEAICTMVRADNLIGLREIQSAVVEDNSVLENIQSVSISTT